MDNIIRCLYEDRVSGRITQERYDARSVGYEQEQEQADLRQKLKSISEKVAEMDMRKACIREFIQRAKEYMEIMKKSNFLSAQAKENLPESETVTIFTPEEIEKFKAETFSIFKDSKRKYQQAAAYILMLNTRLRTGELLGLLNSDIDLKHKTLTVRQGVKEAYRRSGAEAESDREIKIGKPKSATVSARCR